MPGSGVQVANQKATVIEKFLMGTEDREAHYTTDARTGRTRRHRVQWLGTFHHIEMPHRAL